MQVALHNLNLALKGNRRENTQSNVLSTQNRPDSSGMVAFVSGAACVCPKHCKAIPCGCPHSAATIRTNSGPFHNDERQTFLSKKNKSKKKPLYLEGQRGFYNKLS